MTVKSIGGEASLSLFDRGDFISRCIFEQLDRKYGGTYHLQSCNWFDMKLASYIPLSSSTPPLGLVHCSYLLFREYAMLDLNDYGTLRL